MVGEGGQGSPGRLLCLHGFGETAQSFRRRLAPLAAALAPVELFVPDHSTPWWRASSLCCPSYVGWAESVEFLRELVAASGPFDGVLGYSQGGCLAGMLCALDPQMFRFAVICCGFRSRDGQHSELYSRRIRTPSLHLIGEGDFCLLRWMATGLARDCFEQPELIRHPGGHDLPDDLGQTARFVMRRLDEPGPTAVIEPSGRSDEYDAPLVANDKSS